VSIVVAAIIVIFVLVDLWERFWGRRKREQELQEKLKESHKLIGVLEAQLAEQEIHFLRAEESTKKLQDLFEKLQHQKISADVKLGQKGEVLLPFLSEFPYKEDEIKGLFQPIDLIVFRDTEIVFVEVKTGDAQLSEKQRKIREIIKNGNVRFEVHRLNEKGVVVK
jgi:predicted Holliday junction resolvase-like endonuclease